MQLYLLTCRLGKAPDKPHLNPMPKDKLDFRFFLSSPELAAILVFLGLAALLDRQMLTPAIPEFHLLDSTYQLENLNLDDDLYSQWVRHCDLLFSNHKSKTGQAVLNPPSLL